MLSLSGIKLSLGNEKLSPAIADDNDPKPTATLRRIVGGIVGGTYLSIVRMRGSSWKMNEGMLVYYQLRLTVLFRPRPWLAMDLHLHDARLETCMHVWQHPTD